MIIYNKKSTHEFSKKKKEYTWIVTKKALNSTAAKYQGYSSLTLQQQKRAKSNTCLLSHLPSHCLLWEAYLIKKWLSKNSQLLKITINARGMVTYLTSCLAHCIMPTMRLTTSFVYILKQRTSNLDNNFEYIKNKQHTQHQTRWWWEWFVRL